MGNTNDTQRSTSATESNFQVSSGQGEHPGRPNRASDAQRPLSPYTKSNRPSTVSPASYASTETTVPAGSRKCVRSFGRSYGRCTRLQSRGRVLDGGAAEVSYPRDWLDPPPRTLIVDLGRAPRWIPCANRKFPMEERQVHRVVSRAAAQQQ